MSFKIAIDGPSSSGKSTLAKRIAKELGFTYIDTGAMYRAMGYYFLSNNLDLNDIEVVNSNVNNVSIEINYVDGVQHVLLNGEDISGFSSFLTAGFLRVILSNKKNQSKAQAVIAIAPDRKENLKPLKIAKNALKP